MTVDSRVSRVSSSRLDFAGVLPAWLELERLFFEQALDQAEVAEELGEIGRQDRTSLAYGANEVIVEAGLKRHVAGPGAMKSVVV